MFVYVRAAVLSFSLVALAIQSVSVRADEIEEKKARRLLEGHAEMIEQFAYLEVKLKTLEFDGTRRAKDGSFKLNYTFNGIASDKKAGYFTLEFAFDKDGKLLTMKETSRSWILATFTESKLLLALLKGVVANFLSDPAIKPETKKLMEGFVKSGDVNQLLVTMLNGKNGH